MALKADLQVENFNRFVDLQFQNLTAEERDRIPFEIYRTCFRNDQFSIEKTSFLTQLFLLYIAKNKAIYIVAEDMDNGVGIEDFQKFKVEQKKRQVDVSQAEHYVSRGTFVLGNKELIDYMGHLNSISISSAMTYTLRLKNTKTSRIPNYRNEMIYLSSLVMFYEGNKRKLLKHKQITVSDLYVLCYLCDDKERNARPCYKEVYKEAYNSSRVQIMNAFRKLSDLNYIVRLGKGPTSMYKITALGKSLLAEIIKKYIVP